MGECIIARRGGSGGLDSSKLAYRVLRNISQGSTFKFTANPEKEYLVVVNGGDGAFVMIIHGLKLLYAYGGIDGNQNVCIDVSNKFSVSGNIISISGNGVFNGRAWIHTNDAALS